MLNAYVTYPQDRVSIKHKHYLGLKRLFFQMSDEVPDNVQRPPGFVKCGYPPVMDDIIAQLVVGLEPAPERGLLDRVAGKGFVKARDAVVAEVVVLVQQAPEDALEVADSPPLVQSVEDFLRAELGRRLGDYNSFIGMAVTDTGGGGLEQDAVRHR